MNSLTDLRDVVDVLIGVDTHVHGVLFVNRPRPITPDGTGR